MSATRTSPIRVLATTGLIVAVCGITGTRAATITFSTAVFDSVDDVSTNGTFVVAVNYGEAGTSDTTINGVTFTGVNVDPSGGDVTNNGVTIAESGTEWQGYNSNSNYQGAISDSAVQALGDSFAFGKGSGSPERIDISGLTIGKTYYLQLFMEDDRGLASGRTLDVKSSDWLGANPTSPAATDLDDFDFTGEDQLVNGTFVADDGDSNPANGGEQSFWVDKDESGGIAFNGLQLREIPEPASLALLGLCLTALLSRRQRR